MNKGLQATLIVGSIVIGAAGVGALGYWLGRSMNSAPQQEIPVGPVSTNTVTTSNVTPPSQPKPTKPDVPSSFKLYEDSTYETSFAYPRDWGTADPEGCKGADQLPGCLVDSRDLLFGPSEALGGFRSVRLTTLDVYDDVGADSGFDLSADRDLLLDVYQSKSAKSVDRAIYLPPTNAAVIAGTAARYIENFDGSWRGFYYYATVGQNDPEFNSNTKTANHVLAVLTDGDAIVVQLEAFLGDSFNENPPTSFAFSEDECTSQLIADNGGAPDYSCQVPDELVTLFEDEVTPFVESLQAV